MPKPRARRATAPPIRPSPMMPRVAPWTSWPSSWSGFHPSQRPRRTSASPSTTRRAAASRSANARSAVVSVSTSGVLVTTTSRAAAAVEVDVVVADGVVGHRAQFRRDRQQRRIDALGEETEQPVGVAHAGDERRPRNRLRAAVGPDACRTLQARQRFARQRKRDEDAWATSPVRTRSRHARPPRSSARRTPRASSRRAARGSSLRTTVRSPAGVSQTATACDGGAAREDDGVADDRRRSDVVVVESGTGGFGGGDLGGDVLVAVAVRVRLVREHGARLLAEDAAQIGDQADPARGAAASPLARAPRPCAPTPSRLKWLKGPPANGIEPVTVQRAAGGDPQVPRERLDGGGKAAVELGGREVGRRDAGERQRALADQDRAEPAVAGAAAARAPRRASTARRRADRSSGARRGPSRAGALGRADEDAPPPGSRSTGSRGASCRGTRAWRSSATRRGSSSALTGSRARRAGSRPRPC